MKTRTVTIRVTKTGIKRATMGGRTCPVARGAHAAGLRHCYVGLLWIQFEWPGVGAKIDLPKRAKSFIAKWDNNEPVEPFEFSVKVPV